ncbi:hypothetical protein GBAR_LOCUS15, partial [Geodia barretti]
MTIGCSVHGADSLLVSLGQTHSRKMADELTCINHVNDCSGIHYITEGQSLAECWKKVKRLGLVALS